MDQASPTPLELADANQARASDPRASAWVSANAGTGKTHVLVRRILRLLLDGAAPEAILCLTYTKMAAAEMENRLLATLSAWAVMRPEELASALAKVLDRPASAVELETARRLFACTLEARGGLKIHTIHGFCERLLQRFPLEAGIVPNFSILDEQEQLALKGDALNRVLSEGAARPDGVLGQALRRVVLQTGEHSFRSLVQSAIAKRREIDALQGLHGARTNWGARECQVLKELFGLPPHTDEAALVEAVAAAIPMDELQEMADLLRRYASKPSDLKLLQQIETLIEAEGPARLAAMRAFVYSQKEVRKTLCTNEIRAHAPELCARIETARHRFAELELELRKLIAAEASSALLIVADAMLSRYAEAKRAQAALDYDDLIDRTRSLLSRSEAAAWVLFKIDGGIDHILVDEAQDTNPDQWAIVMALAEEFYAGASASQKRRTLFAVGDEKQSIYSFQGADPWQFGDHGRRFANKAGNAGMTWHNVPLTLSFRSTWPVLQAVDAVFARPEARTGLGAPVDNVIEHHAVRDGEAGLVELWEIEKVEKPQKTAAFEPWSESKAAGLAVEALAERVARKIAHWLKTGEPLHARGRPIRPGDILILVRSREPFVAPMMRWLKRLQIPVAGADRMVLIEQPAVADLLALADALLMPKDDLALAVTLKSPLFGLDDDALFTLAHQRPGSLWDALQDRAGEPLFAEAANILQRWLAQTDYSPPYEFLASVLATTGDDGRSMRFRMLTRLGPEAAEAIDEMMELALRFDGDAPPSLQDFVQTLRAEDLEIKRDMEQVHDEVRIMTVHAAKGLQAPIVFLPDTCKAPQNGGLRLHEVPRDGPPGTPCHLVYGGPGNGPAIPAVVEASERRKRLEEEESHRLLYVAMTRAADRLYIGGWAAANAKGNGEERSWYPLIEAGLKGIATETKDEDGRTVWRLESAAETVRPDHGEFERASYEPLPLPGWATRPVTPERVPEPITPSRMSLGPDEEAPLAEPSPLGPRALATDNRFTRGRLIHALLQYLPEIAVEAREDAAQRFVAVKGASLEPARQAEIVAEALAVMRHPDFADLFAPGSLAEVPIVARIGEGETARTLSGQIDRLAIREQDILVLDYKTNRPPPLVPEDVSPIYIAQLAAYRLALSGMFPGKKIRTALLWTDGPRLMELPESLVAQGARTLLQGSRS